MCSSTNIWLALIQVLAWTYSSSVAAAAAATLSSSSTFAEKIGYRVMLIAQVPFFAGHWTLVSSALRVKYPVGGKGTYLKVRTQKYGGEYTDHVKFINALRNL